MKFCVNCGAELKKGIKFCTSCGAEVEELEQEVEEKVVKKPKNSSKKAKEEVKKVEEEIKEEVEEVEEEVNNYEPEQPPKKKNTGKIVVLSILIVAFIASIVVLVILLLNRSNNSSSKEETNNGSEISNDGDYTGVWKRQLIIEKDGKEYSNDYSELVFNKDGTFEYNEGEDEKDSEYVLDGTYEVVGNKIYINFGVSTSTLYIDNGKLCIAYKDCEDYYVKNSKKYTVRVDYYDYYGDYTYDEENEKVKVYIFEAGGCPYCEAQVEYLEGLDSYGDKFEIVRKELYVDHVNWEEGKDYELGKKTAELFNKNGFEDANIYGTPFVVISNKYAVTSYSRDLEDIIDEAYSEGHVDVVGCLEDGGSNCFYGY